MGLSKPLLSIIIPFYNEPDNARAVLQAIKSYNCEDIEWILVNNGSTDTLTFEILQMSSEITFLNLETNIGFGGGIKAGLEIATSDYLAWMPGNLKVHPISPKIILDRFLLENESNSGLVLIKALRIGRGAIPQLKTVASSLLVSLMGGVVLKDIGGTPTLVSHNCLPFIMDTPNDYSFELAAYFNLKKNRCAEYRIPNAYLTRIFGQTHWQYGLKPELLLLKSQVEFVLRERRVDRRGKN
jgi:glycosyltransferase involved in cell wall biosynthesis